MCARAIAPTLRNCSDRGDPEANPSAAGCVPLLFQIAGDGFVQPLRNGKPNQRASNQWRAHHSARRVMAGSIATARNAGTVDAIAATAVNNNAAAR